MKKLLLYFVLGLTIFLFQFKPTFAYRNALADVNRDGVVSQNDVDLVKKFFNFVNPTGKAALADITQDSVVNILDLSFVGGRVGMNISTCQTADISDNGTVDQADLDYIGKFFGQIDNSRNMQADLTGDGYVNILDLSRAGGLMGCSWRKTANPFQ